MKLFQLDGIREVTGYVTEHVIIRFMILQFYSDFFSLNEIIL